MGIIGTILLHLHGEQGVDVCGRFTAALSQVHHSHCKQEKELGNPI